MVSKWSFAWILVFFMGGPRGIDAQSNITTTSSSTHYPQCSGYLPFIQDSVCDEINNNADCGYDGGDCCLCTCVDSLTKSCGYDADFNCTDPNVPVDCGETPSPAAAFGFPNCTGYLWGLGDELCDDDLNNEECGYDGGDCCRCTCRSSDNYDNCGYYGYDCLDPDAPTDCESASPTPSPAAGLGYPDCTGDMSDLQNGYCDWDLNNEECGYDGGDCCSCTCEDGIYYTCGTYGYDCEDPTALIDCATPSPAAGLGYPDCAGDMSDLQNGYCDGDLNNEECGYDGGDCCSCTCEDGVYYTCGSNGFDCEDPTVPSDCEPLGSTPTPAAGLGYPDCTGDLSDIQNGYCDWNLNSEDCGYDGGDCCECSCTGVLCGQNGYTCLDPDPCPIEEGDEGQSSDNASLYITVAAIAFIACICITCIVLFTILHVRTKRRAETAATIHTQPLPPQPASTRTTDSLAGRHPIFAIPFGRKAPMESSNHAPGTADRSQPNDPSKPSRSEAADVRTHGISLSIPSWQTTARSSTFRSAPTLKDGALEGSTNNVEVGHLPCPDIEETERIWLAVKESRRVQTISEAIFQQETSTSQSGAYAVITGTGINPSNSADGSYAEEKVPMSADEKDSNQDASSGSEWGSDGETETKEAGSRAEPAIPSKKTEGDISDNKEDNIEAPQTGIMDETVDVGET